MTARYRMFADYNAWCNERLYDAASRVSAADYRADRGAFFTSLHGTLNHLLVGDRIRMARGTGEGELPSGQDASLD
ncbi:MAG: DinB family protein, partial [Pseudolabrys sp.]